MKTRAVEDLVLDCQRVIDAAHARQLRAIAALSSGSIFDSQQLALLMRWSDRRAADRLALAARLVDVLPASLDALESGVIDLYQAESIADLTETLTPEKAQEVEALALVKAPQQTGANLRQYLRRQVIKVDPEGAAERAKAKKADRCAGLVSEEDDMAKFFVYLCADKALAIKNRIDKLARDLHDDRTMDQRRADVVCDLLLGKPSNVQAHIYVTVPITMLLGLDNQPGELAGYGPITADLVREIAGDATWHRLLTDPESGALLDFGTKTYRPPAALRRFIKARDKTCRTPGCMQPADRCDIDHTKPFPEGPTSPCNCGLTCRRHHRMKQHPDWNLAQPTPGTFVLTTPTGRSYTREPEPAYHR
jgi:hypothetical protein